MAYYVVGDCGCNYEAYTKEQIDELLKNYPKYKRCTKAKYDEMYSYYHPTEFDSIISDWSNVENGLYYISGSYCFAEIVNGTIVNLIKNKGYYHRKFPNVVYYYDGLCQSDSLKPADMGPELEYDDNTLYIITDDTSIEDLKEQVNLNIVHIDNIETGEAKVGWAEKTDFSESWSGWKDINSSITLNQHGTYQIIVKKQIDNNVSLYNTLIYWNGENTGTILQNNFTDNNSAWLIILKNGKMTISASSNLPNAITTSSSIATGFTDVHIMYRIIK